MGNRSLALLHNAKLKGFTDPSVTCFGESWPSPRKTKITLPSYQLKAIVAAQGSGCAMPWVPCWKSLTAVCICVELFLTNSEPETFTAFYFVLLPQNLPSHFPFLFQPILLKSRLLIRWKCFWGTGSVPLLLHTPVAICLKPCAPFHVIPHF